MGENAPICTSNMTTTLSAAFLLVMLLLPGCLSDQTTCMRDYEEGHNLYFACFCDDPSHVVRVGDEGEDYFSLADFAYKLSGALFSKNLFVSFKSCRFLRVLLDQRELTRIGSPFFRPDLRWRGLAFDHVYHLDLKRHASAESGGQFLAQEEEDDIHISALAVALIRLERGAKFGNLVSGGNATTLYIDLNGSNGEEDIDVNGFDSDKIFFVTNSQDEVPLQEGEDFHVKMKSLTAEMQNKSSLLSLGLSLSTIIVLLGIFGLVVVANHRQKRKQQLKAILRAKNLGPVLESRKIAKEISDNFKLPRYHQQSLRLKRHSSSSSSRYQRNQQAAASPGKLPMHTPDIEDGPAKHYPLFKESLGSKIKRMEINDLLSGIMYRMRKVEYIPEQLDVSKRPPQPPPLPAKKTAAGKKDAAPPPLPARGLETSFFYKDSSLTATSSSSSSASSARNSVKGLDAIRSPSVGDVHHETVEVHVDKRERSNSSVSSSQSYSSSSSEAGSYVSKIAQKVFVDYAPPKSESASKTSTRKAAKPEASAAAKSADFHGELKEKCMTFFSSVTRSRRSSENEEEEREKDKANTRL